MHRALHHDHEIRAARIGLSREQRRIEHAVAEELGSDDAMMLRDPETAHDREAMISRVEPTPHMEHPGIILANRAQLSRGDGREWPILSIDAGAPLATVTLGMRRVLIALGLAVAAVACACGVVVDIRGAPIGGDASTRPPEDDAIANDGPGPTPTEAGDSSIDDASSTELACSPLSPRTFDSSDACATVEVAECATSPEAGAAAAFVTGAPCDAGKRVCACALASTGIDYVLEGRDCRCVR